MKKFYCNPLMEISFVSYEDVIATSLQSGSDGTDLEADWSSRVSGVGGVE